MLTTSIILFAVAAIFGLILITSLLKKKEIPKLTAVIHGLVAATALVILIIFSVNSAGASPTLSVVLFIIAAIGGIILFARDLGKKPGPAWLALIHAGVAVISFLILLVFAFSM